MKRLPLISAASLLSMGLFLRAEPTQDAPPPEDLVPATKNEINAIFRWVPPPDPFAGIPASREGSGTSWQPDSTPASGEHLAGSEWRLLFNTNVFTNYDTLAGPRGSDQFNSVNWITLNGVRTVGDNELSLRSTLCLDVETSSGGGYPILFQTGETYRGAGLLNSPQPKDFFMELAGRYRRNLGDDAAAFVYLAAAGAPAFGPTSFTHRASAMANPAAPISHQWLDSTGISYGVATVGISQRKWQFEGSCFNGREDEGDGWSMSVAPMRSYAGRISFNPSRNWSFQTSLALLEGAEAFDRSASQTRVTTSIQHHLALTGRANIATTLALGQAMLERASTDAFLIESAWNTGRGCTLFGRAEYVEKLGRQLSAGVPNEKYPLRTVTIGASHDFTPGRPFSIAVGCACTYTFTPEGLDRFYGDNPAGLLLFVRVSPGRQRYVAMD